MNFLELCRRVRQEAGISGNGPMSVLNNTGEMRRIVDWVADAWIDVQTHRADWNFMKASFNFSIDAPDFEFSAADAGIVSFKRWLPESFRLYQTDIGENDGIDILPITYEDYRRYYLTGPQTLSRPVAFAISPQRAVMLGPRPMREYTVIGEYVKASQKLAGDTDVPDIDEDYHMVIVWGALKKYARYTAAGEIYADAVNKYDRYINRMEMIYLPDVVLADALV